MAELLGVALVPTSASNEVTLGETSVNSLADSLPALGTWPRFRKLGPGTSDEALAVARRRLA